MNTLTQMLMICGPTIIAILMSAWGFRVAYLIGKRDAFSELIEAQRKQMRDRCNELLNGHREVETVNGGKLRVISADEYYRKQY